MGVQLLARHPRLDQHVEILAIDLDDAVHAAHIDRHTALEGRHLALERGADAEGDDGRLEAVGKPGDGRHVLGRARKDDDIGRMDRMPGFVMPMTFQDRRLGRNAIRPQQIGQGLEQPRIVAPDGFAVHALPYPPPPGVSMTKTSPASMSVRSVPLSSSTPPFLRSTRFLPRAPVVPPLTP
jgi:hypothetical protein